MKIIFYIKSLFYWPIKTNILPNYPNFILNSPNIQASKKSNLQFFPNPFNRYTNNCYPNSNNELSNTQSESSTKKKFYTRTRFSPQEDKELIRLVSLYGENDWNKISLELYNQSQKKFQRTSKQCKDRYINYLSPDIQNKEWTLEEDQCLICYFCQYPYRWKILKKFLSGRSEVAIKNRFKHLQKDGMKFLRPMIGQNQQNQVLINNFSNIQSFSQVQKILNQNNSYR